jgi:hypothetical protein
MGSKTRALNTTIKCARWPMGSKKRAHMKCRSRLTLLGSQELTAPLLFY